MVKKISIVRTKRGATISVVAGDQIYQETYDSWEQALHNVVSLHSWTQQTTQGVAHTPPRAPSQSMELVLQNA